jgi:hypothetical protein
MSYASGLSAKVAAAALVTFSVSSLLPFAAPQAQAAPNMPEWKGLKDHQGLGDLIRDLHSGAVVIVLKPASDGGSIEAYALQQPPSTLTVYTKDDDKAWLPTDPPQPSTIKGEGEITNILIYEGSDCTRIKLGGQWVTTC